MTTLTLPPHTFNEPSNDYHQMSGLYLSSHLLGKFRKSPTLYWSTIQGKEKKEERPAYAFGRAAHSLILEGEEAFREEFTTGGPINAKTGKHYGAKTKAFSQWASTQSLEVVHPDDMAIIRQMHHRVQQHYGASQLLKSGYAELVIRRDFHSRKCQIRIDWTTEDLAIVDLKTTGNMDYFAEDCDRYGYFHQFAFYQAIAQEAWQQNVSVFVVAAEKAEPFRVSAWDVTNNPKLAEAAKENIEAMEKLSVCERENRWPLTLEEV